MRCPSLSTSRSSGFSFPLEGVPQFQWERGGERAWREHFSAVPDPPHTSLAEPFVYLLSRKRRRRASLEGAFLLRLLFADNVTESFDQRRIEGGTGFQLDGCQGFFAGEGQTARFIGGETVEGLRDCDDSG